jgi:hypothetical protein
MGHPLAWLRRDFLERRPGRHKDSRGRLSPRECRWHWQTDGSGRATRPSVQLAARRASASFWET